MACSGGRRAAPAASDDARAAGTAGDPGATTAVASDAAVTNDAAVDAVDGGPPLDRSALAVELGSIGAGRASIAARVDRAVGFAVRTDEGTVRACGGAVALYEEAIDRTLATAEPATCARVRDRRVCRMRAWAPIDGDEPNLALVFRDDRLEAAIWKQQVTTGDVATLLARDLAPCDAGSAVAAATTAAAPTAVITRATMRALIDGRRWADVVDPSTGVAVVAYRSLDGAPDRKASRLACGAAAVRELDGRRARLLAALAEDEGVEVVGCTNRPRPMCWIGFAGEGEIVALFRFRASPTATGGLVLDSVADVNASYRPYDTEPVVAGLRARQLDQRCP